MIAHARPTKIDKLLRDGAGQLGLSLSKSVIDSMILYIDILIEWNNRINLTSLTNNVDAAILHFLDSLTVFKVVPHNSTLTILDIGSGGGFPGMVLRIADPTKKVSLLDRSSKKIVFLKHVANRLNLRDVEFLNFDYRSFFEYRGRSLFDVVTARGFSSNPKVLDSFAHLIKPSGAMVRMVGPSQEIDSEVFQFFELSDIWEGLLPFSSHRRKVIRYEIIGR
jgi:16S rRNA (guanine527-N7)-methyltransferase